MTAVSMTHLATLEHLTNFKVNDESHWFCTPTLLLSFLRNRASRPKNLELFVKSIDCKDPEEMVDLKQEIERQKLEDASFISLSYTDLNGRRLLV